MTFIYSTIIQYKIISSHFRLICHNTYYVQYHTNNLNSYTFTGETTIKDIIIYIILYNQVYIYLGLNKDDKIYKYVSTSACYNLVCLIDHASFINFDTSI